ALAAAELEGPDPLPDRVRAVGALVALGNDGPRTEEPRPLGRPVAARARAVLLAGDDDERNALLLVAHRRIVDRHLLARGEVARVAALAPRPEAASEPHVGT